MIQANDLDAVNEFFKNQSKVELNLGCGPNPNPSYIGLDSLPLEGVSIVADLEKGLGFIEDNTIDKVISRHFLEHIENYENLIFDIYRVLNVGGIHEAIVPYFSNPHYYSDYTHKRTFGVYSFEYFTSEQYSKLKRKVPFFYNKVEFKEISIKIVFKDGNNKVFNAIKKWIFTPIINLTAGSQEFYEFYLAYILPASEIKFTMKK
jgi:predicted SAM-dependent methyltransferase